jgi:uncharacterized membrane protein HdeD (DUF308 family)
MRRCRGLIEGENDMTSFRSSRGLPGWVTGLLALIGILLIVVAILYFAEPAHSLPSFFPGHTGHGTKTRPKHGIAALVVGLIVLALAWVSRSRSRR